MTHFRRKLITASAVTLLAFLIPLNALGQKDAFDSVVRSVDDSNRASGAGYTSEYALNAAARRLAYRSRQFEWTLERELNRSYLDGTPGEKHVNQMSVRFHKAAEALNSLYAVGRSVDNSRREAFNLLRLGNELDDFVSQAQVSRTTLKSWDAINRELFLLATVYDFDDHAENADSQADAYTQVVEYHSAASSHSRIWLWPM